MKIKPVILNEIKTKHTNFELDLEMKSNVTFIAGDSGTGKSAVFSFLREMSSEDGRILCLNYIDISKGVKDVIMQSKGKVIVIDNADILLDDDLRKYIASDTQNQYVIMGRNPAGLLLSQDEIYEMESTVQGDITHFVLRSFFMV